MQDASGQLTQVPDEHVVPWYALSPQEARARAASPPGGLEPAEAARRLRASGPNELLAAQAVSWQAVLLAQLRNTLVLILVGAALLSGFLGHTVESAVILVIVLFAVVLGFVQEFRAERALEALGRLAAPAATVLRGGVAQRVPAREVVPGDVIVLVAGDRIPADARLLLAVNLRTEEAALTGESQPVDKDPAALPGHPLPTGDRLNMVHAGTTVATGRGEAVVVATGMQTEFGRIAGLLEGVGTEPTPLQRDLDHLGLVLGRAALVVIVLIAVAGYLRGLPLLDTLLFAVALAVAVVPEALPAVVTVSLAVGVQRMVRRNALVRRLTAVETLGSTSVILTDKTGTLTRDEMTVRRLHVAGREVDVSGAGYAPVGAFSAADGEDLPLGVLSEMLRAAALANDARLQQEPGATAPVWRIHGDPTEAALLVAAAKAGIHREALELRLPRTHEEPFSAETRRMVTVHADGNAYLACMKGAPEAVLSLCNRQRLEDGPVLLDAAGRERLLAVARSMAARALRVLAIASARSTSPAMVPGEFEFLGFAGLADPPRPEAREALARAASAGIRVVMITGDHPLTARAVASEIGLPGAQNVLEGQALDAMDEAALLRAVQGTAVFARVSPAHKLRIAQAWQATGAIVAMTGDGVNDAPALKQADIGIAMGISGTDVSREAAAMTLTDDNFASIVAAVEEGRGVFDNIRKYLMYLLSSNIGEIGLMAVATLAGLPLPLAAVQLLYVNLATDGLPAMALAVDPPEPGLMDRPPRDPKGGVFPAPVVVLMLLGGAWSTVVNVSLFVWSLRDAGGLPHAMSMCFVSLVLIQLAKAYSFRSDRESVFRRPFGNRWLNLAVGWEVLMLVAIVSIAPLRGLFGLVPLGMHDWLLAAAAALTVVPVLEAGKWGVRRALLGDGSSRGHGPLPQ